MLGTRTKQVFSYGRRGHRIVNVSEDREQLKARHVEPVHRKHESTPSPSPSPPPTPIVRRRKLPKSAPLSSPESAKQVAVSKKVKRSPKVAKSGKVEVAHPVRQPLGSFHANVPGSPAIPPNLRKKRKAPVGKGTPLKTHSPFVDVDIIVLDAKGRRISQERRVSRSDVQVNPMAALPAGGGHQANIAGPSTQIFSDDTDEDTPIVKPRRNARTRARPIVISSDESESEEEVGTMAKLPSLALTVQLAEGSGPSSRTTVPSRHIATHIPPIQSAPQRVLPLPTNAPRIYPCKPSQPRLPVAREPPVVHPAPKITAPSPLPGPPPAFMPWKKSSMYALTSPALYRTKARELTPIRSRQGRPNIFPTPPSPPSPTTPSDFDLTLDFSQLNLSPPRETAHIAAAPAYLRPLLAECAQEAPYEFSAFIEMFPFDALVQGAEAGAGAPQFQKIGEASYSEVFGIGDVVLKVIPLQREHCAAGGSVEADEPAPSDPRDVLKEIIVTRAMGTCCAGFVELLRAYVVRGKYPSLLLDLWDEYHATKGSESVRPDTFTVSQAYAIIVLPNGGPDLERTRSRACSLFWQITRTLAEAEELVGFEHRDLHWGQILVKNVPAPSRRTTGKKLPMDHAAHGVQATVIDLGLARMDAEDGASGPRWTPFDEEIFEGEGDYQFDVYRMMRAHNGDAWEEFRPLSNVMWLHYLALKLLHSKRLRAPSAARKAWLRHHPSSAPALSTSTEPKSAADVLRIAVGRGWVS
ncbi:hypothetical protein B0H21DRAFT_876161 [Amylocystis lapponica]|nr:hypothetical protein B0H21DRAFT_876161 [Amylocystis lapponica]